MQPITPIFSFGTVPINQTTYPPWQQPQLITVRPENNVYGQQIMQPVTYNPPIVQSGGYRTQIPFITPIAQPPIAQPPISQPSNIRSPQVIVSQSPQVIVSQSPQVIVSQFPRVPSQRVPPVTIPRVPPVTIPRVPPVTVPRASVGPLPRTPPTVPRTPPNVPRAPPVTVPRAPVVPLPRVPPVTMPRVPLVTMPRVPLVPLPTDTAPQRNIYQPIVPPLITRLPSPPRVIENFPPRSPGRMTPDEDNQMRLAIMASLNEQYPPENYQNEIDEDIEDTLLQEAIEASMKATREANLATARANDVAITAQQIRDQQDREYEESLRLDQEKEENIRKALEAAEKATQAAKEAEEKLLEAQIVEENRKANLQPPNLLFPIELSNTKDVYTIRFKLPDGRSINHSFNSREPLASIIQQLQFDLKYLGDLVLTIPPRTLITCAPDNSISNCGFGNRITVLVNYP